MQSKIKIFNHPVHPMLVPFPIAFFTATLLCSIVYISTKNVFWFRVEFIANCAGVVMAIAAVFPGIVDWLLIPVSSDAKSTGLKHMIANAVSVGIFGVNAAVNYTYLDVKNPPTQSGVLLSSFGFLVMLYAGFKGWEMVQTYHIGIDDNSKVAVKKTIIEEKNPTNISESPLEQFNE